MLSKKHLLTFQLSALRRTIANQWFSCKFAVNALDDCPISFYHTVDIELTTLFNQLYLNLPIWNIIISASEITLVFSERTVAVSSS